MRHPRSGTGLILGPPNLGQPLADYGQRGQLGLADSALLAEKYLV